MCISAETSFASAAVIGAIGVYILKKKPIKQHKLLALTPLLFALQQFIEGFVWLSLTNEADFGCVQSIASGFYLSFALVIWPLFVPLAIYLWEQTKSRKQMLMPLIIMGAFVSLWEIYWVYIANGYSVNIHDPSGHLQYIREVPYQNIVKYMYVASALLPFFVCSENRVKILGSVFAGSFILSYIFYRPTYESTWCLAAAIISIGIYAVVDYKKKDENEDEQLKVKN